MNKQELIAYLQEKGVENLNEVNLHDQLMARGWGIWDSAIIEKMESASWGIDYHPQGWMTFVKGDKEFWEVIWYTSRGKRMQEYRYRDSELAKNPVWTGLNSRPVTIEEAIELGDQ